MGRRPSLVKTGDGHAMLRPTGRRPQGGRLGRVLRAAMAAAAPIVRVPALKIEGALHHASENFIVGKVGRKAPQPVQIGLGDLVLDRVRHFLFLAGVFGHSGWLA